MSKLANAYAQHAGKPSQPPASDKFHQTSTVTRELRLRAEAETRGAELAAEGHLSIPLEAATLVADHVDEWLRGPDPVASEDKRRVLEGQLKVLQF